MSSNHIRTSCPVCRKEITTQSLPQHACFEADIHEHSVLYKYWIRKRQNTGHTFPLTGPQLISLVEEAGITPEQIGRRKGQYHLARINDEGNYEWGTCRFIPFEENMRERLPKSYEKLNKLKHTKEWKEKVRKKIKDHYSDPANRKKQSDVMKRAYAKKMSVDSP